MSVYPSLNVSRTVEPDERAVGRAIAETLAPVARIARRSPVDMALDSEAIREAMARRLIHELAAEGFVLRRRGEA